MCFRDSASKVIVAAKSLSQHRPARGSTDHGRRPWAWRAAQREKTIGHLQRKPSQIMNKNEQGRREDGGPHRVSLAKQQGRERDMSNSRLAVTG